MRQRYSYLVRTVVEESKTLLRHKKMVLAVLLGIPLVYPLLISYLYHRATVVERPALLVDRDNSALSRRLALGLDATQGVHIIGRISSLEQGWSAIRRREAELLLFIPDDFSRKVKQVKQAQIKLWINSGNMLTYSAAYGAINGVIGDLNHGLSRQFFYGKGMGREHAERRTFPLAMQAHLLYHPTVNYGGFLVPGVMMIVLQQLVLIALTFSVGMGKEQGLIVPSARYPFTDLEARALALLLFYLLASAFITFIVFPLFGWPMKNPGGAYLLQGAFVLTLCPLGILIAHLAQDRYMPFQLLMFLSIPLFMLSGFAWPLEQMPRYLQLVAAALPATPALHAFRILAMKTGSWQALSPYLGWMMLQFFGYLMISIVVVRTTARRAQHIPSSP